MTRLLLWLVLVIAGIALAALAFEHFTSVREVVQRAVIPGALSQGHAFLENNCTACHTGVAGVEAKNCIVCHADNIAVLQRQPTAFHSDITSCAGCHLEHQGRVARTARMDHVALARAGLSQIRSTPSAHDDARHQLIGWLERNGPRTLTPQLQREEALLNCAACHQTKDRHRGLFGADCAQCHATTKWTIAEFRHSSPASQQCAECHQAPPSHYMMHFMMISKRIASQPNAQAKQCFACHQTTVWNDIRGVGFYKHH